MKINDVIRVDEEKMALFGDNQREFVIARTAFREASNMMEDARANLTRRAEQMFPGLEDFRFTINFHSKTITIDSDKD